jgi:hypothetical protein
MVSNGTFPLPFLVNASKAAILSATANRIYQLAYPSKGTQTELRAFAEQRKPRRKGP